MILVDLFMKPLRSTIDYYGKYTYKIKRIIMYKHKHVTFSYNNIYPDSYYILELLLISLEANLFYNETII